MTLSIRVVVTVEQVVLGVLPSLRVSSGLVLIQTLLQPHHLAAFQFQNHNAAFKHANAAAYYTAIPAQ